MPLLVVVYVIKGSGIFHHWDGEKIELSAGDMVLMPANRRHGIEQTCDGNWHEAYLVLNGEFGDLLFKLDVLDQRQTILKPGINTALIQRFERILHELTVLPDYALPSVLSHALDLLISAYDLHKKRNIPDRQQQVIEAACRMLSGALSEKIDMERIAAASGMSYERFRKLFRQRVGVSPGDYRIKRRIDQARALIDRHHLSNKQVAYELGYPDPFTFSKQFHKVTGLWPEQYRQAARGMNMTI